MTAGSYYAALLHNSRLLIYFYVDLSAPSMMSNARHHPRPYTTCMRSTLQGRRVHAVVMLRLPLPGLSAHHALHVVDDPVVLLLRAEQDDLGVLPDPHRVPRRPVEQVTALD